MLTPEEANAAEVAKYGVVPVGGPVAGPAHDRALCAATALVGAVAVSRTLIGHGLDPLSVYAMGMYLGAAMVGYGVGQKVPAEHRAMLQVACSTVLGIVGAGAISSMGPM